MGHINTIEDDFEYNIKKALIKYSADFETHLEAVQAFKTQEGLESFSKYLAERAESYCDVAELLTELI